MPNHIAAPSPDPNVTLGKPCDTFDVEFVVRGYMTGSTGTSIWTHYKNGAREYCGHSLPEGMSKVSDLPCNIRREGGQSLVIGGSSLVILEEKACNPL